jgi:hypothetical protein
MQYLLQEDHHQCKRMPKYWIMQGSIASICCWFGFGFSFGLVLVLVLVLVLELGFWV